MELDRTCITTERQLIKPAFIWLKSSNISQKRQAMGNLEINSKERGDRQWGNEERNSSIYLETNSDGETLLMLYVPLRSENNFMFYINNTDNLKFFADYIFEVLLIYNKSVFAISLFPATYYKFYFHRCSKQFNTYIHTYMHTYIYTIFASFSKSG